jgi:hypothetical protein
MGKGCTIDIKGGGVEFFRNRVNVGRWNEEEPSVRIDKSSDQPGAGDPINLGAVPCDPKRTACGGGNMFNWDQWKSSIPPTLNTSGQRLGVNALASKECSCSVAELFALLADDDEVAVGEV